VPYSANRVDLAHIIKTVSHVRGHLVEHRVIRGHSAPPTIDLAQVVERECVDEI